jgi:two-component system, cell cycle sensor histidine kinase and response regulator CckA
VSDTGHGIDAANLSRIFDPFFTTREVGEGSGLGLSICYGIVRDHGGEIAARSAPDAGTTFSILLPACLGDVEQTEEVLVAHVEERERGVIAAALDGWGYRVVAASTGSEALDRYRHGGLSAVLLDAALVAADLDGWRAARSGDLRPTPIIFVGLCDEGEGERFMREQATAVLAPPFQLRPLRAAVRAVSKECV